MCTFYNALQQKWKKKPKRFHNKLLWNGQIGDVWYTWAIQYLSYTYHHFEFWLVREKRKLMSNIEFIINEDFISESLFHEVGVNWLKRIYWNNWYFQYIFRWLFGFLTPGMVLYHRKNVYIKQTNLVYTTAVRTL